MYTAKLKFFRGSARKGRLVADLIRGKKAEEAQVVLSFTHKKTAEPMLKLLNSAIANAENIDNVKKEELFISKVIVDEGPTYKRIMPRARGSADTIRKRTSHMIIELDKHRVEEKTDNVEEKTGKTDKVEEKTDKKIKNIEK